MIRLFEILSFYEILSLPQQCLKVFLHESELKADLQPFYAFFGGSWFEILPFTLPKFGVSWGDVQRVFQTLHIIRYRPNFLSFKLSEVFEAETKLSGSHLLDLFLLMQTQINTLGIQNYYYSRVFKNDSFQFPQTQLIRRPKQSRNSRSARLSGRNA